MPLAQWSVLLLCACQVGLNAVDTERDIYVQFVGEQQQVVSGVKEVDVSQGER